MIEPSASGSPERRRRRGRPPVSSTEPSIAISVSLPTGLLQRAAVAAEARGVTVAEIVRRSLARQLNQQKIDEQTMPR
jgi:hypothetical protein